MINDPAQAGSIRYLPQTNPSKFNGEQMVRRNDVDVIRFEPLPIVRLCNG